MFQRSVTVHIDNDGLIIPSFHEGTDQDLRRGIFNILLIALSVSALTVDETLKEVFGEVSTNTDMNRIGISVMLNQLRNAFAHNPWHLKWMIYQKYRKSYSLELDEGQNLRLKQLTLMAMVLNQNILAAWNFGRNSYSIAKGLLVNN